MNFIYSILFTGLTSLILFLTGKNFIDTPGPQEVVIGLSVFFAGITFIFTAVCFFQNLTLKETQKQDIQSITTYKKKISNKKRQMEDYKKEIESSLTKLYPEYEKEMFKAMNPSDAENLSIYLAKYPELKFNGVLKTFTDKLTTILNEVTELEQNLEYVYERIRNRNQCSWFLFKMPLSEELLKEIA